MSNKVKIFLGVLVIAGGVYYFSTKKKSVFFPAPSKKKTLDDEVAEATQKFLEEYPFGSGDGALLAPDRILKVSAYLNATFTQLQKQMFVDYSDEFMSEMDKWAGTHSNTESVDEQNAMDVFMTILANIQTNLEKKYSKPEADKFMAFMANFDPSQIK